MAIPERDNVYNNTTERSVYTRESNGTGWFVGIIVVLALLAIGYLVFSANSGPSTPAVTDTTTTPAVEAPATGSGAAPMTEAPATPAPAAPAETAPAAPAETAPMAPAAPAETAPAAPTTP